LQPLDAAFGLLYFRLAFLDLGFDLAELLCGLGFSVTGIFESILDVAQFLASPASSYVVGETVTAAGVPRIDESPEV
jgi:hypothetical protein